MISEKTETQAGAKQHAAFFRQSGWLMIATIFAGMMSWAVHPLAKFVSSDAYSVFGTMMMVTIILPTMPLQMVFAQQTTSTLARGRERQLSGMIRLCWVWMTIFWVIATVLVIIFNKQIMNRLGLTDPSALWITLLCILAAVLGPQFYGALQGRQDFFWMGWNAIIGGACRPLFAALLVLVFGLGAAGMMIGTFMGLATLAAISIWQTRDLWMLRPEPFDWRSLVREVFPLMCGFGVFQFMFSADTIYARAFFTPEETAPYVAAGTLSRALLWLVLPLAAVAFPKLVQSSLKTEKSNLLGIVLLGTAILAICAGLGLWLTGPLVVKIVYKNAWVGTAVALLPWYAGAMVPLALTSVLINDLMARGRFRVVPILVGLAVIYAFVVPYMLNHVGRKLEIILQTLVVFNSLLFVVCAFAAFVSAKPATAKA